MSAPNPSIPHFRKIFASTLLILIAAVVIWQTGPSKEKPSPNTYQDRKPDPKILHNPQPRMVEPSDAAAPRLRPAAPAAAAAEDRANRAEQQLAEISAPLNSDMASTMFHAEVKAGQSIVTGGYQTADGKNQFTLVKPKIIVGRNGEKQIEINSQLIAVSPEDTYRSGLDSLATNARNTLQHAESWEESDVTQTMTLIRSSADSAELSQPKAVVGPGDRFSIQMVSDDNNSYTLNGTAELSPNGTDVILKARIEQKELK